MLDTLKVARELEAGGFAREQAEALANTLAAGLAEADALRRDLAVFREETRGRFQLLSWMVAFNLGLSIAILARLFLA